MKKLTVKNNVIRPAVIGIIVAVLGIVLLVYYRYFATEKWAASYIVSAITLIVGVALAISALFRLIEIKREEKTALSGESATAEFISYGSEKSIGKVAVYYVEYSYEKDGKKYQKSQSVYLVRGADAESGGKVSYKGIQRKPYARLRPSQNADGAQRRGGRA